jgi:hypothetical protein
MRTAESFAGTDTATVKSPYGLHRETQNSTLAIFARRLILAQEILAMNPEFYLILDSSDLTDELADRVYEAGFDDSSFTMRGGKAAIWMCHRKGDFKQVVHDALEEAREGGLKVTHVEIENEVFA